MLYYVKRSCGLQKLLTAIIFVYYKHVTLLHDAGREKKGECEDTLFTNIVNSFDRAQKQLRNFVIFHRINKAQNYERSNIFFLNLLMCTKY